MDTIPDDAIDTIIKTKARDMYRAEFLAMAVELKELRARFNKGEDKAIGDGGGEWGAGERIRKKLLDMKLGDVLIIPGIGHRWRVQKEASWSNTP